MSANDRINSYKDIIARLEPITFEGLSDEVRAQMSIAISLKRLADSVEATRKSAHGPGSESAKWGCICKTCKG